jgi:guanine nucleotide-binding protein G(i) subunit alpha
MPLLNLNLSSENDTFRLTILALPTMIPCNFFSAQVAEAMRSLWRDSAFREACRRGQLGEFELGGSAVYFFTSLERIAWHDYIPTDQDIFQLPVQAPGPFEVDIPIGERSYRLVDPGNWWERRKWIQMFEHMDAFIFLADLSEYDELLYEDENQVSACLMIQSRLN